MKIIIILIFTINIAQAYEHRKRIAVIDTGVSIKQERADYMCKDSKHSGLDEMGHGQNIVGLIVERMDKSEYCIDFYAAGNTFNVDSYLNHLYTISFDSRIVGLNLSIGGQPHKPNVFDNMEYRRLKVISDRGTKIFISAGNSGALLTPNCTYYPACHKSAIKKLTIVGNKGNNNSNRGDLVDIMIDGNNKGYPKMTGTSQSAAILTGEYFSH